MCYFLDSNVKTNQFIKVINISFFPPKIEDCVYNIQIVSYGIKSLKQE